MTDEETDFDSYLVTVAERDIDLLLMEEFHVSDSFVDWFCEQVGFASASFCGAWHSVSDADGETDLLLRVRVGHERVGILIENKIGALEQDRQDERYHLRGARHQQKGKFDRFVTCICAPQAYLGGLRKDSLYQHTISYEEIADRFGKLEGPRHAWRQRIMREAIAQGRRGYTMVVNPTISEFHITYWEYLRNRHPRILMKKPTPKGGKSSWIIMKAANFPNGVQIHHKLNYHVVELGFNGRTMSELLAIKANWPNEIVPCQKGRIATLSINVPEIEMAKGVAAQEASLEAVLAAVNKLIPYACLFEAKSAC